MATNRLIQRLFGADESGVGEDAVAVSNRRVVETFRAAGAIGEGDLVCFNVADGGAGEVVMEVIECPAGAHPIGAAIASAASGEDVRVVIGGIAEAQVKGSESNGAGGEQNAVISSGDYLCISNTTAGTLYKFTGGDDVIPNAVAVDDVGSGDAAASLTVIMLKSF